MTERTIVVVAFDGVRLLDVSGPLEVFTVANEHGAAYGVRVASLGGRDIVTSGGVRLGVDAVLESIDDAPAIVLVPGSPDLTTVDERLVAQVAQLVATAEQVASVRRRLRAGRGRSPRPSPSSHALGTGRPLGR